ncbi:MAG: hypothetical protein WC942_04870 [Clostridia bacterium]|jgi:hypothetical protein
MKTTAEKIKVMQAWLDGSLIKVSSEDGSCFTIDNTEGEITWNWLYHDFNIVLREVWVNDKYPHLVFYSKIDAKNFAPGGKLKRFIEAPDGH